MSNTSTISGKGRAELPAPEAAGFSPLVWPQVYEERLGHGLMDVTISCHHAGRRGLHRGAQQHCSGREGKNPAQTQGHGQAVPEMLHRELVTVVEKAPIHTWQSLDDMGGDLGWHECPPWCTVPGDGWAPSVPWICRQQQSWWSPEMGNER